MAQTERLLRYVRSATERVAASRVPAAVAWGAVVAVVSMTQSVAASTSTSTSVVGQSAVTEASRVACSGALGNAIFLLAGLIALLLFIGGILQIALGFMKMGGGGGGGMQRQSSGRQGLMNGALTLTGGLVLGSIGGILSYLGVDISACLDTSNIIMIAPPLEYVAPALEIAVVTG